MTAPDDLQRDYFDYLAYCAAKDQRPLTPNAWTLARINALADKLDQLIAERQAERGDAK